MNTFVLSPMLKEAIKVGLAVLLAIVSALSLGWDKAYWSVVPVIVLAANDSFGHAIQKGRNRLIGTIAGVIVAVFLISLFAQNHLLFIINYSLLLGFCVFMSFHKKYGYAFTIAFVVCAVICCVGNFDNQQVFSFATLRIQETMLGIIIFSLVFRFIWPEKTEQLFFQRYEFFVQNLQQISADLLASVAQDSPIHLNEPATVRGLIAQLNELINVPLSGSHELTNKHQYWKQKVKACEVAQHQLDKLAELDLVNKCCTEYKQRVKNIVELVDFIEEAGEHSFSERLQHLHDKSEKEKTKPSKYTQTLNARLSSALKSVFILVTSLLFWIYMPMPGGYVVPLMASIFACIVATMPSYLLKHVFLGTIGWGVVFIAQYILIMPLMTELWQLAILYFIDVILIWGICRTPIMRLQKLLAGNLMLAIPMGALRLTPSYDIVTPLTMLLMTLIVLGVVTFYSKTFDNL